MQKLIRLNLYIQYIIQYITQTKATQQTPLLTYYDENIT